MALAKGGAAFIPGVARFACGRSYGSDSPRYRYGVWLRHVLATAECDLDTAACFVIARRRGR